MCDVTDVILTLQNTVDLYSRQFSHASYSASQTWQ